jgi:hypothetical protein
MRYAAAYPFAPRQARSLRIGHCARCHAPVLADEEHYGAGPDLVHGACGTQPLDAGDRAPAAPLRAATQQVRRTRRVAGLPSACATGQL